MGALRRRRVRDERHRAARDGCRGRGGAASRRLGSRHRRHAAPRSRGPRRRRCLRRAHGVDGAERLVVDRGRSLVRRSGEEPRAPRLRRRRSRGGDSPWTPASGRRARPRGVARRSTLLGAPRQGRAGTRPGRRRSCRAPAGIDRVLERARVAGRRSTRSRRVARVVGAGSLRPSARGAPSLPRDSRDPAHPVPCGPRRRPRRPFSRPLADDESGRGCAARSARLRSGPARRRLGVHPTCARRGRSSVGGPRVERGRPRRACASRRGDRTRPGFQGAGRPTRRHPAPGCSPRAPRYGRVAGRDRLSRPRRRGWKPCHLGGRPAEEPRRGRQRAWPPGPARDEQSHGLVGRGVEDLPRQPDGRHGRIDVRDRAKARAG